jgi:hypothetical protein
LLLDSAAIREVRKRDILTRHALCDDEHALIGARASGMRAPDNFRDGRVYPARRFRSEELDELFAQLFTAVDDEEIRFLDEFAAGLGTVERRDDRARCNPAFIKNRARCSSP